MDNDRIIPYIEPIIRFCYNRVSDRYDAEDLASEILCSVLEGLEKYKIESLDAWIWRVARNRYARFCGEKNRPSIMFLGIDNLYDSPDYCETDAEDTEQKYEAIFTCMHTLAREYRDIFVDHYIEDVSIKKLSEKYSLPETTIKWRLNVGRQRIKERIGEYDMDKIYKRLNWHVSCNGQIDTGKYLRTQAERAICEAAYENPLTVEEISLKTGLPTLYIEDTLPGLIQGDCIVQIGKKYATDFIIRHQCDRPEYSYFHSLEWEPLAKDLEQIIRSNEHKIKNIGFYGSERGINEISHIIAHLSLRDITLRIIRDDFNLTNPPFPPRKDGGYGWLLVDEMAEESPEDWHLPPPYSCINNSAQGSKGCYYYYSIGKHFSDNINSSLGFRLLAKRDNMSEPENGFFGSNNIDEIDLAHLISNHLIIKNDSGYVYNIPTFTEKQFEDLKNTVRVSDDTILAKKLREIMHIHYNAICESLESCVPKRLKNQVHQRTIGDFYELPNGIIGHVIDKLITMGVIREPSIMDSHFVDGVFFISGNYQHI